MVQDIHMDYMHSMAFGLVENNHTLQWLAWTPAWLWTDTAC
jgi:hypothetical protein